MNRRFFGGVFAALFLIPTFAYAAKTLDYKPGLVEERLAAGETLLVDYAADWCSTCRRQERILTELRENNPAFDENITFIRIDWDKYKNHAVTSTRNVPRRSTLLVLRGDEELGRIIAGTNAKAIEDLLTKAL
ncbi:MAG: thioredoxin family protein [Acidiferrobacterales bacterium]|nr:thioredoxin family protein [Acidiferrobacterales bacterium]